MEKFPRPGANTENPSSAETVDLETLKDQLRAHIRDNIIKLNELREKAVAAEDNAHKKIQEAWKRGLEGEEFSGDYIIDPKDKAKIALYELSDDMRDAVHAHGVGSNRPTTDRDFPINALVSILATGILKGDTAPLSGGLNQNVFTDAPFILLSNRGDKLAEMDEQNVDLRLKGLRTVLVNGQYEGLTDDLKRAFPWVSFRTANQIDDSVFDKTEPNYKSYEDRISEMAQAELEKRQNTK